MGDTLRSVNWAVFLLATLVVLYSPMGGTQSGASVRVVETWPPGDDVVLGRGQNFYLRLAYEADAPVGIWVTPYFHGTRVNVGSSPSPTYSGSGEALGWFFFMQPGDEVDEIRIKAGDGRTDSTPVVAVWRGHVVGGSEAGDAGSQPAWVTNMLAQAKAEQDEAYRARMSQPVSAGEVSMLNGFMLGIFALGLAGFALPAWALWRWRGGWRLAAAVPATMMVFVVLRLIFDVMRDPKSHNLWPFEILMSGALSVAVIAVLGAFRKRVGTEG